MTSPKQALTHQLVAAVAPHLSATAAAPTQAPKAVVKTAEQLAKQVLRHQNKLAKAAKPAAADPKAARNALAGELLAAVQPQLAPGDTPAFVTDTLKRLAGRLLKQRRKMAKQLAKLTKTGSAKLFSTELTPFQAPQSARRRSTPASPAPAPRAASPKPRVPTTKPALAVVHTATPVAAA
ncbi:hypothetical protein GCM10028821_47460 [Hymenobacter jeollabukensis]